MQALLTLSMLLFIHFVVAPLKGDGPCRRVLRSGCKECEEQKKTKVDVYKGLREGLDGNLADEVARRRKLWDEQLGTKDKDASTGKLIQRIKVTVEGKTLVIEIRESGDGGTKVEPAETSLQAAFDKDKEAKGAQTAKDSLADMIKSFTSVAEKRPSEIPTVNVASVVVDQLLDNFKKKLPHTTASVEEKHIKSLNVKSADDVAELLPRIRNALLSAVLELKKLK